MKQMLGYWAQSVVFFTAYPFVIRILLQYQDPHIEAELSKNSQTIAPLIS
jgi:hypothetical protein